MQNFEVTEIHGLRLAYVNNRVRYGRTLAKNLLSTPRAASSLHRLGKLAEQWGGAGQKALASYCHAIVNSAGFLYVD